MYISKTVFFIYFICLYVQSRPQSANNKKSSEISYAHTFTNIIANASIDINGVGPDQTAPAGAARPGLTLFKTKGLQNFGCD